MADFLSAAGKWLGPINAAEIIHGIPRNLLVAIAYQESHFRDSIISGAIKSSAGAVGIMQLLPRYFPGAGKNPLSDIATAATFLAGLYKTFKDWQVSVAAYNWGEGDIEHSYAKNADHYYLAQMPAETQNYVRDIFAEVPLPGILLAQPTISAHNQTPTIEVANVNTTVGAIPWYKSPQTIGLITTFIAAGIALFPKVGAKFGLTSPDAISAAVQNIFAGISVVAPMIGVIVRSMQKTGQPITLTQAGADAHPATLAAQAAAVSAALPAPVETVAATTAVAAPLTPIPGKPWGK